MANFLLSLLNNEAFLTLLATACAALWSAWKTWSWRQEHANAAMAKIEDILEAAVHQQYEEKVRALKSARADGKLTPEEAAQMNKEAGLRAIEIGKDVGIDIAATVGGPLLSLAVEKAVDRRGGNRNLDPSVMSLLP